MAEPVATRLVEIRKMASQITDDGHVPAECTADLGAPCTGHDAERVAGVVEAVLALADDLAATKGEGPGYNATRACGLRFRSEITAALLGEAPGPKLDGPWEVAADGDRG